MQIALKDERGNIIREFFFSNNNEGISALIQSASHYGKSTAVVESTGNMWIRIHDTLEENGIDTILANPYKTKIIAKQERLTVIHGSTSLTLYARVNLSFIRVHQIIRMNTEHSERLLSEGRGGDSAWLA